MRKLRGIFMVILMSTMLFGCSNGGQAQKSKEPVSNQPTQEEKVEQKRSQANTILPDASEFFPDGKVTILGSNDDSLVMVEEITVDDYDTYIKKVKEIGFTDITFQGENDNGKMFFAYNENREYYVQINYLNNVNRIDIICEYVVDDSDNG